MQKIALLSLALLGLGSGHALADMPLNCTGNACNDIDVTWSGSQQGFMVENFGTRQIIFTLHAGGWNCPQASQTKRIIHGRSRLFQLPTMCATEANYQ